MIVVGISILVCVLLMAFLGIADVWDKLGCDKSLQIFAILLGVVGLILTLIGMTRI